MIGGSHPFEEYKQSQDNGGGKMAREHNQGSSLMEFMNGPENDGFQQAQDEMPIGLSTNNSQMSPRRQNSQMQQEEFKTSEEKIKSQAIYKLNSIQDSPQKFQELESMIRNRSKELQVLIKLEDIVLDAQLLAINDATKQELVEELKCSICLGLVRLPACMCQSCEKIFCQSCMKDVENQYYKNLTQRSNKQHDDHFKFNKKQEIMEKESLINDGYNHYNRSEMLCPLCKVIYVEAKIPRWFLNQLKSLEFISCQFCGDDGVPRGQTILYENYIRHLTTSCKKSYIGSYPCQMNTKTSNLERFEMISSTNQRGQIHFDYYCKDCGEHVKAQYVGRHICSLNKLYQRAKEQILELQVCEQICKHCRKTVQAAKKQSGLRKVLVFSEKSCDECIDEQMKLLFEQWHGNLMHYYGNGNGRFISPWHHYQLRMIEGQMKELDQNVFEVKYQKIIKQAKEINKEGLQS